jgi:glutamate formiminotransferase
MVECVPNFSEGRDISKIDAIERAIASVAGAVVLHRTSDGDHNRSVITFAGPGEAVLESAVRAAAVAVELIDLRLQTGVHPRLGALDVLPFVPLEGSTLAECVDLAHRAGERIWRELGVPVYFYEAAAKLPVRQRLEDVRRGQFEGMREAVLSDASKHPDVGGPGLHPSAGAVIAGARKFLIAFNINLATNDVEIARNIARNIRASSGGFPALKALGMPLASRGQVQISMNLTDFERTGLFTVFDAVQKLACENGVEIANSELIGLMPRRALERVAAEFLKLEDFKSDRVVENRIQALRQDTT